MNSDALHTVEWDKFIGKCYVPLSLFGTVPSESFATTMTEWSRRRTRIGKVKAAIENKEGDELPGSIGDIGFIASGKVLSAVELRIVASCICDCDRVFAFFSKLGTDLKIYSIPLSLKALSNDILRYVDSNGGIHPDHPRLSPLIRQRQLLENRRSETIKRISDSFADVLENRNPVYKNGRLDFSVPSDKINLVPGVRTGISNTYKSFYVEPPELFVSNNEVGENELLVEKRKKEIISAYGRELMGYEKIILSICDNARLLDFYLASARLVSAHDYREVIVDDSIKLDSALYPLLDNMKPLDISVSGRMSVVSGANAGGKTVLLKTLAFHCLSNQLFTFAPAAGPSHLPLFDDVFFDMGDGESVESGLSSFSSHLHNLTELSNSPVLGSSLVLLDEPERGTSPREGENFAQAVIGFLLEKGSFVFVTSHSDRLKLLALADSRIENFAFEFSKGSSTYRILKGVCGISHSDDLIRKSGINGRILEILDEVNAENSDQASELVVKLCTLEKEKSAELAAVAGMRIQLEELRKKADEREREVLQREIEVARREIALSDRKPANIRHSRKENLQVIEKKQTELNDLSDCRLQSGDAVRVNNTAKEGVVEELLDDGRKVRVAFGNMHFVFNRYELAKVAAKSKPSAGGVYFKGTVKPLFVLDIRGMRAEESVAVLDKQIDNAILAGLDSFSIICGYGDGILKKTCVRVLGGYDKLLSFRFADADDGGEGKIYVKIM